MNALSSITNAATDAGKGATDTLSGAGAQAQKALSNDPIPKGNSTAQDDNNSTTKASETAAAANPPQNSIPSLSTASNKVTDGLSSAGTTTVTTAQNSLAHSAAGVQTTVTGPIPIVGKVTEGIGKAPLAQRLVGRDPDAAEKGYLARAYEYVAAGAEYVCDAAGDVVAVAGVRRTTGRGVKEEGEKGEE